MMIKQPIFRGKKGFMQAIVDTGIALLLILIGLLIVMLFTKNLENNKIEQGEQILFETNANHLTALYLKQPVVVDGIEMSMADLVVLATTNKDDTNEQYLSALKKETTSFFSRTEYLKEYEQIYVKQSEQTLYEYYPWTALAKDNAPGYVYGNSVFVSVYLPSLNQNKVELLLRFVKK